MFTASQVLKINSRIRNADAVAELANQIKESGVNVRPQDPFQVWESHPAISPALDAMKDREICIAIDLANGGCRAIGSLIASPITSKRRFLKKAGSSAKSG